MSPIMHFTTMIWSLKIVRLLVKYHAEVNDKLKKRMTAMRGSNRLNVLKQQIDYHKTRVPDEAVRVVELFYDGYSAPKNKNRYTMYQKFVMNLSLKTAL
jgi:hypothetical protein